MLLLKNNNLECEESDSGDDENLNNAYTFMVDSSLELDLDGDTAKAIVYLRIKWFSYFLRCLRSPSKPMTAVIFGVSSQHVFARAIPSPFLEFHLTDPSVVKIFRKKSKCLKLLLAS